MHHFKALILNSHKKDKFDDINNNYMHTPESIDTKLLYSNENDTINTSE